MRLALLQLRWELLDIYRRLRHHPVTLVGLVAGFPCVLAAYAVFGSWISEQLLAAHGRGPAALAAALDRDARIFALILLAMGSSIVVGNLFNRRPRQLLAHHRCMPLSDGELYLARKLSEDGAFALMVLVPLCGAIALRLVLGGVDPLLGLALFTAPFALASVCIIGVRALVLIGIFALPARLLSWRAALWLAIGAVILLLRPVAELSRSLWASSETLYLPPTDWIGALARAWLEDRRALAAGLLAAALAIAALAWWVDFLIFRAVFLRRFDRLMSRLTGSGLTGGRLGFLERLLDRLPSGLRQRPLRAVVKSEVLRVARDPVLSLAVQIPVLVMTLSVAAAELTFHQGGAEGQLPPELGHWTRTSAAATLGLLLVIGACTQAVLLIAWEGRRLGPLRALPYSETWLYLGKARAAAFLTAVTWLAVYFGALVLSGPWPRLSPLGTWFLFPFLILCAAVLAGRIGATVGAIFARPEAKNPLLGVGLVGLGLQLSLTFLVLASLALSVLPPALFGPRFLFTLPILTALWWLALPLLEGEGIRALRRRRIE